MLDDDDNDDDDDDEFKQLWPFFDLGFAAGKKHALLDSKYRQKSCPCRTEGLRLKEFWSLLIEEFLFLYFTKKMCKVSIPRKLENESG